MVNYGLTCLVGIVIWAAWSKASGWRKAYASAKSSDFPIFLSPVHLRDMWWLILHPSLVPVLKLFPKRWTTPWLSMGQVFNIWKIGHKPFAEIDSDTFMLSTPQGNLLWTCDPRICHELEASYPKLQKAIEMLKFLEVYGPTVASVEGNTWKTHRRVVMSGFNPSTNAAVWKEAKEQTEALITRWSKDDNTVKQMRHWTNRLALHVISAVFFQKKLMWSEEAGGIEPVPPGHQMSYEQALFTILARLGFILMTPRVLLDSIPIQRVREANTALNEFTKYLQEFIAVSKARVDELAVKKNKTILESIVVAGSSPAVLEGRPIFSEAETMGNLFMVLAAGHETTGNTMSFALDLLALYPEHQQSIQRDLDRLLAERPRAEWTVEREYLLLQNGWLGAFLKEVLRVYCVVQWLPRVATVPIDVVDSMGQAYTVPKDTMCVYNFSAAFQNPSTWQPCKIPAARRAELHNSPALDFDPSRWLKGDGATDTASDDSTPLHFPFGQGPHVCPGRLFALVEMTAMLSTVLLDHKLEFVVDDNTKRRCGGNEEKARQETRDNAFRMLVDDITSNQNIELHKELPIRLVKRP